MADEKQREESRPKSEKTPESKETPAKTLPTTPKELTSEEQMALYEEKLKEDDWGHQPC